MNGGPSTVVGSSTTPMNNTVPVRLSRIARKNGRLTINGIGGTDSSATAVGTGPSKKIKLPVEASVPSSLTSTTA